MFSSFVILLYFVIFVTNYQKKKNIYKTYTVPDAVFALFSPVVWCNSRRFLPFRYGGMGYHARLHCCHPRDTNSKMRGRRRYPNRKEGHPKVTVKNNSPPRYEAESCKYGQDIVTRKNVSGAHCRKRQYQPYKKNKQLKTFRTILLNYYIANWSRMYCSAVLLPRLIFYCFCICYCIMLQVLLHSEGTSRQTVYHLFSDIHNLRRL